MTSGLPCVARLAGVGLAYGATRALDGIDLAIPAGGIIGFIGPDGVGKSSLLSLIAGATRIRQGQVQVLGGDMSDRRHRGATCQRIAFMPQGLGRNLYPTLSVFENVDFFGRLFGHAQVAREQRIATLLESTGLAPFADRPAGRLSGGMKQKLGLCCALIHDPDLLILDEPTTGVDPLSRRQFWDLIATIRAGRAGMTVLVATAYMEEAARFDRLVAMDAGRILATGTPQELLAQTGAETLDSAFIALLPAAKRAGYVPVEVPPRAANGESDITIEADGLTMRFGDFVAADRVSFRIGRGEIFGFLGSNGCGKTTTMKMLTGLLPASEGRARLFGHEVDPHDIEIRRRVGYMSQAFSLYTELTVRQNLELHARLFRLAPTAMPARIAEVARRFDIAGVMDSLPDTLPLGVRQRLSLAVAMIHGPDILILDEPTSGVDPVARDQLWRILVELSRQDGVTIFISTHFMNEAACCDRISLMHAGQVLVTGTPAEVIAGAGSATLEDAFIHHLEAAIGDAPAATQARRVLPVATTPAVRQQPRGFDPRRLFSYARRETLELRRDPIRLTLAVLGSLILMLVMGAGITLDVENLSFAVLDRDRTTTSTEYVLGIAGSRYFTERPPLRDYQDLDRRMRAGEISLAIEIPPGFGRDVARGHAVQIGAWVDGAMPQRAETVRGYVQGVHAHWLAERAREALGAAAIAANFTIETRFRYNPDVRSIVAMVPAVIALLLMLIPAVLAAISVVREKELGSIVNLYVTPVTQLEFLLGKQLPYIALGMLNCLLLTVCGVFGFGVPFTGSLVAFLVAALLYVTAATALGLLISTFMRSQIAALFGTAVITLLPAVSFSGMTDPVSSLVGIGAVIGRAYPTTYFLTVARGAFSKGLHFADLSATLVPLLIAGPLLVGLSAILLKKQAN